MQTHLHASCAQTHTHANKIPHLQTRLYTPTHRCLHRQPDMREPRNLKRPARFSDSFVDGEEDLPPVYNTQNQPFEDELENAHTQQQQRSQQQPRQPSQRAVKQEKSGSGKKGSGKGRQSQAADTMRSPLQPLQERGVAAQTPLGTQAQSQSPRGKMCCMDPQSQSQRGKHNRNHKEVNTIAVTKNTIGITKR